MLIFIICLSTCLLQAPPPEYPVCSDRSALECLRQHCSQQQSSFAKLILTCQTRCCALICANVWRGVTELKARLLTRCSRSSDFCGNEELLLQWPFQLSRTYIKQRKGEKNRSTIGLLYLVYLDLSRVFCPSCFCFSLCSDDFREDTPWNNF